MRHRVRLLVLLAILAIAVSAQVARADGDPGSDVLVFQPLFLAADSGVSINQQARLGALLSEARRRGMPIRVAIIAAPSDLGAITELWRRPRAYAKFLGIELSLAYTGRLLIVMPNGFGFNWPGHSTIAAYRTLGAIAIGPGGSGLATAAQRAVTSLAAADGLKLTVPSGTASPSGSSAPSAVNTVKAPGSSADVAAAAAMAALAVLITLALLAWRMGVHRRLTRSRLRSHLAGLRPRRLRSSVAVAGATPLVAGGVFVALVLLGPARTAQSNALASNPYLDPGTSLSRTAPGFTLTDQAGRPVSLSSFRGKVVLLAFNDSECSTICPLTTSAMRDAKTMLGAAGSRVQLLGIDANPKATSLEDVASYTELHGLVHAWRFLTGTLPELQQVWKAYGVYAAIQGGEISHTPALFVIDPQGRLRKLYMTQQSYAAVGQLGQLLAQEASRLLSGHPVVHARFSYSQIAGISPTTPTMLPRIGGGNVRLGPGRARLYLFFATWDQEITSLGGHLDALNAYVNSAASASLPPLTAVDEASVEPSRVALPSFLTALRQRLSYPVGLDLSGRVADGYEVQGQPWFVLTSPSGRIIWYWQVAISGWLSSSALIAHVRAALARAPRAPAAATVQQKLAGSPPALAALHQQASRLLGTSSALLTRVRALRGYPIVINAWASWCAPCQAEFGLFASASARYGRRVAFLGADTADSPGNAQSFLTQHPVSYPSYQTSMSGLDPLVPQGLAGLPTTIFLNRAGKLAYVHIGQYQSQGTLDADIQTYALGG